MNVRCLVFLAGLLAGQVYAEAPRGYYRFPTLHNDTIVFTAEGDLWRVNNKGGVAERITSHVGAETSAAISPDGKTLAFSAEYEGPTEVYTMPLAGGLPERRTFHGTVARVAGWTPDGKLLYGTDAFSTLPDAQLATIDLKSGERTLLPLAQAAQGAFDDSGKQLFFTRLARQSSSTKRYQGGTAENLWRFDMNDTEATPLAPDYKGQSRHPMWWQGRVYFVTDRDGIMNLWSMKADGSDAKQLTQHKEFDVKSPALHNGRIVYQHGADLRLLEISSRKDTTLDIRLTSDFDQLRERWVKRPMDFLTSTHVSPNGDRVVLTARGKIFVAPVEAGRFVELPSKSEVRYRNARFLPDGKSLVALSDESGELEYWKLPANGLGAGAALTTNGSVFRFTGVPSPDGKFLAWTDKDHKLWLHDLETQKTSEIATSARGGFEDLAWAPDSQWLAYTDAASNLVQQIHLYRLADNSHTAVTSDRVESYSPAWSPDGKWLYFLSDRELRSLVSSPWGVRQPEPFFTETTKIYALALTNDLRWPFQPKDELQDDKSDDAKDEKKEDKKDEKKIEPATDKTKSADNKKNDAEKTDKAKTEMNGKDKKPKVEPVQINLAGLASRLYEVPLPAGNYSGLEVTAKHLLFTARDVGFGAKAHLKQLEMSDKSPKPKTLVEEVGSYELTADGKKLLIRKGDALHVIAADAGAPAKLDDRVSLDGWTLSIIPREEWRQIYTESWRMLRDFFYDRGMHGVNWVAMRDKYQPLIERVSDRAELNDVIYDLAGELSALHIFVRFGDQREGADQIRPASLGAKLVRDEAAGGWRIERIFRADPDYPNQFAPLSQPGVNAVAGEIITAINGRSTLSVASPELLLRNQAGKQVLLDLKSKDSSTNRQVIVKPISTDRESDLRYDEWELTRREQVEKLGAGQIGYVHLRAMGAGDIADWARGFFPVFNRQGLIIDVRHNRGGNIDAWILEKLLRKAWFYWQPRVGEPYWNMHYAFRGHVTVLCNEKTASDGEAFSEGFKRLGLGKVIGTRTWGGEIWLSTQRWLVDSGMASAAEIGVYGPEGEWLIEGHGVDPDFVVDNLPHATFKGKDAQLEAAVKHLQELIAKDPRPVPPAPKHPDKSFKPK